MEEPAVFQVLAIYPIYSELFRSNYVIGRGIGDALIAEGRKRELLPLIFILLLLDALSSVDPPRPYQLRGSGCDDFGNTR